MPSPVTAPRCANALLALALSAVLLAGCQPAAEAPTLSTHAVPPARAQAIAEAINTTLMQGDAPPLGRAEVAAPGTLVVRAPSGMQASIASTIAALQGVETAEPAQVQVEAWWIGTTPEAAPLPAELADVAKALGSDANALRVRDHVRLGVAASGQLANANGDAMLMNVRAAPEGGTFVIDLQVAQTRADVARDRGPLRYEGEVRVVPGEFTVLTSRPDGSGGSESLVLRLTD